MKSVAVLGCGPAGLLVAHAAELAGWNFRIYSRKKKSPLYGAQYLHAQIPSLDCGASTTVRYALRGTPAEYRYKVYGDQWDGTISAEELLENHEAWDIRYTYDGLWDRYQDEVVDFAFAGDLAKMSIMQKRHDLVISTVPRKIWAEPGDEFRSTRVWALGDTDDNRDRVIRMYRPPEDTVFCCGTDEHEWYRVSNIYGYATMEWPYYNKSGAPPARGASVVEKPLSHNSTAASDFLHVGRFGAWRKGLLTHDAFFTASQAFMEDTIRGPVCW